MLNVTYPTSAVMEEIDQNLLPRLTQVSPLFQMFPLSEVDASQIIFEQRDSYMGLMQARGYNNPAPRVNQVGYRKWTITPGVYGEFIPVDEQQITTRRRPGTFADPISIDDLVIERQEQLLTRQTNRMEAVGWNLLQNGDYSVANAQGQLVAQDGYVPQTFASAVTWDTHATATPLADFRAVQLKHRGFSILLGSQATAYMNRITFNHLIANTNSADLFGRRTTGLQTIEGLAAYNELAMKDDLPQISVYDEGWLTEKTFAAYPPNPPFNAFIGPGVVVVCGQRTNKAQIGKWALTTNATAVNRSSAPYAFVWDSAVQGGGRPPRTIEVHRGFNGAPLIYYPSSVVVMTVGTFTS